MFSSFLIAIFFLLFHIFLYLLEYLEKMLNNSGKCSILVSFLKSLEFNHQKQFWSYFKIHDGELFISKYISVISIKYYHMSFWSLLRFSKVFPYLNILLLKRFPMICIPELKPSWS